MPNAATSIRAAKEGLSEAKRFFAGDIWRTRLSDLPPWKRRFFRVLRVPLLALRGFKEDACMLRASSLTFYTMLSIVPVAALAFGIAKGFGYQKVLEEQLYKNFPGQEEVVQRVVVFAQSLLETTKGGVIAGIGLVLLFWAGIKVLSNIEHSFNSIWRVDQPRSIARKFSDYLAIMLISPLLVILQSSAAVFITTHVNQIAQEIAPFDYFSSLIQLSFKLIPFVIVWVLFTMVYLIMPNTRVKFTSGVIAGVVAGTGYQLFQGLYISLQVGAARYNAIYGSFAALPLFLTWLQVSWVIVLFGAEVSYAQQHAAEYEFEAETTQASPGLRKLIALQIARLVVHKFVEGQSPLTATTITAALDQPPRLTVRVLGELVESGVLNEVRLDPSMQPAYVPARDVAQFTISFVIEALEARGLNEPLLPDNQASASLAGAMEQLRESLRQSPGNRCLKDL
ncbi:MAG: YhjD/YihY/BrkB family envelope integrity protein [Desulfobacterales bacterium]|jgi:membrane protein